MSGNLAFKGIKYLSFGQAFLQIRGEGGGGGKPLLNSLCFLIRKLSYVNVSEKGILSAQNVETGFQSEMKRR